MKNKYINDEDLFGFFLSLSMYLTDMFIVWLLMGVV